MPVINSNWVVHHGHMIGERIVKTNIILASTIFTVGIIGATPVQASYMSNCNKLIAAWEACKEAGGKCVAESKRIEVECKCHRLRQGSWKLVTAAVGKDGVCAPPWPPTGAPDPSPPPHDRTDEPEKRKPVTTYGGERGPNEKRKPN